MIERDDDYDYLLSLGYDIDIENLISIQMEKDDELYEYRPCAYYAVGFGVEINKPMFIKCGISESYIRRFNVYERWAKKHDLICWPIERWMFDDKEDALAFEQDALSLRKGKIKLGNYTKKFHRKKLKEIISKFPHQSELFNFNHKVSFDSGGFPYLPFQWDDYWFHCDLPMDHPAWEKFVGKWEY